ncbi:hypothetical protein P3S68_011767 [Capsicum galapagoense]
MDEETPNRRLIRGIENIPMINCGAPSFDLGISQLDSENADFLAELKVDKSRAESRTKQKNDHVNNHSSMVHSQSRDDLMDTSKISVVGLSKKKERILHLLAKRKGLNVLRHLNLKGEAMKLTMMMR